MKNIQTYLIVLFYMLCQTIYAQTQPETIDKLGKECKLGNIHSCDSLMDIALNDIKYLARLAAVQQYYKFDKDVRIDISKIIDQRILTDIAKNDFNVTLKKNAITKIEDQSLLYDIVNNKKDNSSALLAGRIFALDKLSEVEYYNQIIEIINNYHDNDNGEEVLAAIGTLKIIKSDETLNKNIEELKIHLNITLNSQAFVEKDNQFIKANKDYLDFSIKITSNKKDPFFYTNYVKNDYRKIELKELIGEVGIGSIDIHTLCYDLINPFSENDLLMISQGSKIYYLRWAAGHILKDKYDNDTLNPQATMEESLFEKDTVTDYEGNDYNTVKIGQQWWMAENLKATKYNDGTSIPLVTNAMKWQKLTSPAYCWYNNDISHKDRYGALYNWYTVNTGNLCPSGWHVPTRDEWAELLNYVGIKTSGDKLRETGSKHWRSPGVGETNPTGFTALPGGEHTNINNALTFRDMRFAGYWWSATLADSPQDACNSIGPRNLLIEYNSRIAWLVCALEEEGLSVRCVKDRN